jgi:hypothetical protein
MTVHNGDHDDVEPGGAASKIFQCVLRTQELDSVAVRDQGPVEDVEPHTVRIAAQTTKKNAMTARSIHKASISRVSQQTLKLSRGHHSLKN